MDGLEGLTPEEKARILALGPPKDPSANIEWVDKLKLISRRTWTTKKPELRVALARLDLLNAGYAEEARLLTNTRLHTAWQRLGQDNKKEQGELMAARNQAAATEPVQKKQRKQQQRKKDGSKFRVFFFCAPWAFR